VGNISQGVSNYYQANDVLGVNKRCFIQTQTQSFHLFRLLVEGILKHAFYSLFRSIIMA